MRLGIPKSSCQGFTLLELVVVLVLIAILAAMIVPQMQGSYEEASLRKSARQLISVFGLAYSRAVATHHVQRVNIDSVSRHYFVEESLSRATSGTEFKPLNDLSGFSGEIESRISIELRDPSETTDGDDSTQAKSIDDLEATFSGVAFYPDGTAIGREIVLKDRSGFQLVLQVNAATAHVQIMDDSEPR
jgi:type II secretion system protein H